MSAVDQTRLLAPGFKVNKARKGEELDFSASADAMNSSFNGDMSMGPITRSKRKSMEEDEDAPIITPRNVKQKTAASTAASNKENASASSIAAARKPAAASTALKPINMRPATASVASKPAPAATKATPRTAVAAPAAATKRPGTAPSKPAASAAPAAKGRVAAPSAASKAISVASSAQSVLLDRVSQLEAQMAKWAAAPGAAPSSSSAAPSVVVDKSQLNEKEQELQIARDENKSLMERLEEIRRQMEIREDSYSRLSAQKDELQIGNTDLRTRLTKITNDCHELNERIEKLQSEQRRLRYELEEKTAESQQRAMRIRELEEQLANKTAELQTMESKRRAEESYRRKLHNQLQELKGNVRVFCRLRSLLPHEPKPMDEHFLFPEACDSTGIDVVGLPSMSATGKQQAGARHSFSFDRVFGPSSSQEDVFEEISQLVQSSLDGYKTTIFAYGQTGSGKTFTMEGPEGAHLDESKRAMRGMIPRSVEQIFATATALAEQGWTYTFEISFLEIYNETIRDLLSKEASAAGDHEIKHGPDGTSIVVTGLTAVPVEQPSRVHELLKQAAQNRSVAATKMNEHSSRSHSVFIMKMHGHNSISGQSCSGQMNLIDLAGSERLAQTGATGDRLKEAQHINSSLSSLGDVIAALAAKGGKASRHVPFRNSKLTYLLSDSLSGDSKVLMFVALSPMSESLNETLCSLRFAAKVNSCQIGTAQRNVKF